MAEIFCYQLNYDVPLNVWCVSTCETCISCVNWTHLSLVSVISYEFLYTFKLFPATMSNRIGFLLSDFAHVVL